MTEFSNQDTKDIVTQIEKTISHVIVGKGKITRLMLTAILAEGHILLEDVPGTGKTKLAKTLAASLSATFSRIQFTPDLLPADVTGLSIFDREQNQFVIRKGPVFTNVLLADEINRATPRTQAGLLECMEERQVTIDGETLPLEGMFLVIATQNPVETAGTFPLPEAQMDRFIMKLKMGHPSKEEELIILNKYMEKDPLKDVQPVLSLEQVKKFKEMSNAVYVHPCIQSYLVDIVGATRNEGKTIMGVSTRGTLAFLRAVKAYAFLEGRGYVIPDDVKAVAVPVLAHRIVLSYGYGGSGQEEKLIEAILNEVKVPTEDCRK